MRYSRESSRVGWCRTVLSGCIVALAVSWTVGVGAEGLSPVQIMAHMQAKFERGVTAEDIAGFHRIVRRLDENGDGHLSLDEYSKNSHFRGNPRGTRGFFAAADMNRDGLMSANEYGWQRVITDEARKIFFAMDVDSDRRVARKEFLQSPIVRDKGIAEIIFRGLDTDGNAELTLPEYLRVWGRWARAGRQLGRLV